MTTNPENSANFSDSTPESNEAPAPQALRIPLNETSHFDREGFSGNVYPIPEGLGIKALLVEVHGRHPRKRMLEGTTRTYLVTDGIGTFTLGSEDGDTSYDVSTGDLFVIPAGGEYEYDGAMTLFEVNVSPDESFGDEKLE